MKVSMNNKILDLYNGIARVHGFKIDRAAKRTLDRLIPEGVLHPDGKINGIFLPFLAGRLAMELRGTASADQLIEALQAEKLSSAIQAGALLEQLDLGNVYKAMLREKEKALDALEMRDRLIALNEHDSRFGLDPSINREIAARCLVEAIGFDAAHVYTVDPKGETWLHRYVAGEAEDALFKDSSVPAERTIKDFITRYIQKALSKEMLIQLKQSGLIDFGRTDEWGFVHIKDNANFKQTLQERELSPREREDRRESLFLIFGREEEGDTYVNVYLAHNWKTARPIPRSGEEEFTLIEAFANSLSPARKLEFAHKKQVKLSITDQLTGLFNRRHFMERLEKEIVRSKRYGRDLSLLILDIDHFKAINDEHGHLIGDAALRAIAKMLRANGIIRDADLVARYGGEEFAVILPETSRNGAAVLAKRLRQKIEEGEKENKFMLSDGETNVELPITVSIGVATRNGDELMDANIIIRKADAALYHAKEAGRNRVVVA